MNRDQHALIGCICSLGILFLLRCQPSELLFFLVLISALAGSSLPDKLEPPVHWTHRARWHSRRMFKRTGFVSAAIFLFTFILISYGFGATVMFIPMSFSFSYFLHLLADSRTPMGLPEV